MELDSSEADYLASLMVPYGHGLHTVRTLIDWWAEAVLLFREVTFDQDGQNPKGLTPDDFVGALLIRQGIEDGLGPAGSHQRVASLEAVDLLFCLSTVPDDAGYVVALAQSPVGPPRDYSGWWWHRFPGQGALFEASREWHRLQE